VDILTLAQGSGDTTLPEDGIDSLVKAIFPAQVTAVVDIHCDLPLTNLHEHGASLPWPPHFKYYFSKGVHPHCATDYSDDVHASLVEAMSHPSCVAWGECGLDYFKNDVSTHPIQRAVFARQLTAAVAAGKPIIIHTRAADDDTLRILREHVPRDHRMHVHCFTAGPVLARALMAEWPNAYIGVTGVVGYRDMDHVTGLLESGEIPVGRLLLETDSPYMAPRWAYAWMAAQTPELKKRKFIVSHAGMIPFTAEHALAPINAGRRARGEAEMGLVEMLDVTRGNAARMYGIDV
jgi:TatD DNase family protein